MKKIFALVFITFFSFSFNANAKTRQTVIPGGQTIGICMMTEGLLVIDTAEVTDENGNKINTAENAGIKKGDRIISADGNTLKTSENLTDYVQIRKNDIVLTIKRNEAILNTIVTPIKTAEGYKLGIWIRDSTAGIGTITYINPKTKSFGALGHGISDIDTSTLLICREGSILECTPTKPTPGKKGAPGELNGNFSDNIIGTLSYNTPFGVFGSFKNLNFLNSQKTLQTAFSDEISEGPASIYCNVDGLGVCEYSIEIKKINKENNEGKNIVFKVCDPNLILKTGGIVPGMSGSPIIQNGRIVGAVTHVFVNDPTRGYGIFIKNMLAETEKIK